MAEETPEQKKAREDAERRARLQSYEGLGGNPNSGIREAKTYGGLGPNPDSKIKTAPPVGFGGIRAPSKRFGPPIHSPEDAKHPQKQPQETNTRQTRRYRDFAFQLLHGDGGAQIYWGCLVKTVCLIDTEPIDDGVANVNFGISGQPAISGPETIEPNNLDTDHQLSTHLGWWGNVYLYWECDYDGEVTYCDIRGPGEPTGDEIPALEKTGTYPDTALTRTGDGTASYFILLGTVPSSGPVNQIISSDVYWYITIVREASGATGSSSSGSPSSSPAT